MCAARAIRIGSVLALTLSLVLLDVSPAIANNCVLFSGSANTISACRERRVDAISDGGPEDGGGRIPDQNRFSFRHVTHTEQLPSYDHLMCFETWWTDSSRYAQEQGELFVSMLHIDRYVQILPQPRCPVQKDPPLRAPSWMSQNDRVQDLLLQRYRDQAILPDPVVQVTPRRTLVGMPTYVAISGASYLDIDLLGEIDGAAIRARLTSKYAINWGDGSPQEIVDELRELYPEGHAHVYAKRAEVTVVVTQQWTAQWWGDEGSHGRLENVLRTSASAGPIRVEEAQSILRS